MVVERRCFAVRNVEKGEKVKNAILEEIKPTGIAEVMEMDLSSLKSVEKFAQAWNKKKIPLNILINNAGVLSTSSHVVFAIGVIGLKI